MTKEQLAPTIGQMKIDVSVVIPVFNEEKNIALLSQKLTQELGKVTKNYEIIFVNDGSHDDSFKEIKRSRAKNKRIKLISFSRNFGHMPAIYAGLRETKGKKIIIMDADLQDPPELIPKMYKEAQKGFKVVYGVKTKRKENAVRKLLFNSFYRILNSITTYKMPLDAGTFSLIDRQVVEILVNLPEKNKYFSGLRAWAGFSQTGVEYSRGKRHSGKQASFRRLFKLAFDGMFSFSYLPLRLASLFGIICAFLAILAIIVILTLKVFFAIGIIGWASTMSTILLVSGVQLITLGIIGEYLARIYDEVKQRPEYIISERIGFKK